MTDDSRVYSMTEEDIQRHFGSGFMLGPVVRPKRDQPEPELELEQDDVAGDEHGKP
jgi:hypothetical protein